MAAATPPPLLETGVLTLHRRRHIQEVILEERAIQAGNSSFQSEDAHAAVNLISQERVGNLPAQPPFLTRDLVDENWLQFWTTP